MSHNFSGSGMNVSPMQPNPDMPNNPQFPPNPQYNQNPQFNPNMPGNQHQNHYMNLPNANNPQAINYQNQGRYGRNFYFGMFGPRLQNQY